MMPVQPQALPISLVILAWPCLAGLGGLGYLGWIDCFLYSSPAASLFPSQAVLHDVEELLLGVDAELGVDGSTVGVGGIARNVEFGIDEVFNLVAQYALEAEEQFHPRKHAGKAQQGRRLFPYG